MSKSIDREKLCKEMFGEMPEDVISPINSASDALFWLDAIFTAIKKEAEGGCNLIQIRLLAEAGAYLAMDYGNFAGCQHETMLRSLKAQGLAGEVASDD